MRQRPAAVNATETAPPRPRRAHERRAVRRSRALRSHLRERRSFGNRLLRATGSPRSARGETRARTHAGTGRSCSARTCRPSRTPRSSAQDFHDERRIRDRQRIHSVDLAWPADDRDVGVSCQPRGRANAEVGIVRAAVASAELRAQQSDGSGCERRVLGRAARHRVNLSVEELMLDIAQRLEPEVLVVCVIARHLRGIIACVMRAERRW